MPTCKRSHFFALFLFTLTILQVSAASASLVATPSVMLNEIQPTGLNMSLYAASSKYTLFPGPSPVWGNLQPNGYVDFNLAAAGAGTYNVQLYYSTVQSGAGANLLVNGTLQAAATLPATPTWNSYQLSPATPLVLQAGSSTLRIAAQAAFHAFNLEGVLLTPIPAKAAIVNVISSNVATSLALSQFSDVSLYTLFPGVRPTWGDLQPGGYIDYVVSAKAGNYKLQLDYSSEAVGAANITVNGSALQSITLPSTGSWANFASSTEATLNLPTGDSTLRIAAHSPYSAYNLQGIRLVPVSFGVAPATLDLNPLANLSFYVNPYSEAAENTSYSCASQYPSKPALISNIAAQPQGVWFGDWNTNIQSNVATVVTAAAAKKQTPILVAYDIPLRDCNGYSGGGAVSATVYQQWIQGFALGIGSSKAAVILEPDALSQLYNVSCLNTGQQTERLSLMNYAIETLKQYAPNASVYVDAGHDNSIAAGDMASRLTLAGVGSSTGFALNTSYYGTTTANTSYGEQISALTGNKHFVIDTSRNGQGPTSDQQWCNPANRGLGVPSQAFSSGLVDAYLWVQNPGTSDGTCNGGPQAGTFWGWNACILAANAAF